MVQRAAAMAVRCADERGELVSRVALYLDGRKVRTLTRPNRGTTFVVPVRPKSLQRGTHRVYAVTSSTPESGTRQVTG